MTGTSSSCPVARFAAMPASAIARYRAYHGSGPGANLRTAFGKSSIP